jgi:predicted hotdog family 3-hydroxylacyl-ACP dehydratase
VLIDKPGIARRIPHAGDMCLLDGVLSWDATKIRCVTSTHRWEGNPLRRDGRVGILCGVEYAAQAMALHAALSGDGPDAPTRGYLASVRGVACHADRLDLVPGMLIVEAECVHRAATGAIYGFALHGKGRVLLNGRAVVVLEPGLA